MLTEKICFLETHNIEIVFMYNNYNVRVSMELLYRLAVYEQTEQIWYCMNKNQSTPNVTASSESIFWHKFVDRTTRCTTFEIVECSLFIIICKKSIYLLSHTNLLN